VLARSPLNEIADLRQQTLLHLSTLPRVWTDWLAAAGISDIEPAASLTFDHFYLTLQAALDGLGIAMGPTALVAEDLKTRRLVAPFPDISVPARTYHIYQPEKRAGDPAADVFCRWLEEAAQAEA
jgi:LysR family glycine cleavage system transcriptional activator